jgi:hypothetical protein
MLNRNLIGLLKSFDKKEYREFEKFVSSPFFAKGRNAGPLLKYLKTLHPDYPENKLAPESIHKKINPGKKFSEASVRMQVSALSGLCKDFLSICAYLKRKKETKLYLLDELQNRNINEWSSAEAKQLEKEISSEKKIRIDNLSYLIRLNNFSIIQHEIESRNTRLPEIQYLNGELLPVEFLVTLINNVQNLITGRNSYIMKKKKVFSEALIENINFDKLIDFISGSSLNEHQLVLFYFYRLKFYSSNGDFSYYKKLKDVFLRSRHFFAYNEIYGMIINLSNCCWWQIKLGKAEYKQELFEIYKMMIEDGHIYKPDYIYMDMQIFKNIFYVALNINEIKWAESFFKKYSDKLNPLYSEDVINYSYALLNYSKKLYPKALDMLQKTEYRNYVYKMECQLLTLKIYYELEAVENLFSLADSYSHFLNKNKEENLVIGQRHINFVKALVKLQKAKLDSDKRKLQDIITFVMKNNLIASKEWLIQEINRLEKRVNTSLNSADN